MAATDRRTRLAALAAAVFTVTLWASAFVGIRAAGTEIAPGELALGRLLVASATLGLLVLWRRERLPARRDLPRLAIMGGLWFGAYMVALNAAEQRIDAGTAAILVNVGPILIAVLAGILLGEGFPRPLLAGCVMAFAGVLAIGAGGGHGDGTGAILAVLAAVAYAAAVLAQKPVLARSSPLAVTWVACTIGAAACLPFAPGLLQHADAVSAGSLAWIAYLGVFPTALAFLTWGYALARTTAGRMGATTYLVPPVAILLGWAWLGETPPARALAGGAICLAGVVMARRTRSAAKGSDPDGARQLRARQAPVMAPAGPAGTSRSTRSRRRTTT
jgi:drug/metabolite transporter (DMT)-like permease